MIETRQHDEHGANGEQRDAEGLEDHQQSQNAEADDEILEPEGCLLAHAGGSCSCAHRLSVLTEDMGLRRIGNKMQRFAHLHALVTRHHDANFGAIVGAGVDQGFGTHGLDQFGHRGDRIAGV